MLEDKQVDILHWPAKSPDPNLIENVWPVLERKITKLPHETMTELRHTIEQVISVMSTEEPVTHYFENLYLSFPKRIKQVIDNGGAPLDK